MSSPTAAAEGSNGGDGNDGGDLDGQHALDFRPSHILQRLLRGIREHLDLDVAFIGQFVDGGRRFRYIDADGDSPISVLDSDPIEETFCGHVAAGRLPGYLEVLDSAECEQHERRELIAGVLRDPAAMTLVFQPLRNLQTMEIVALEALARFPGHDKGPQWFFSQATEVGLGIDLSIDDVGMGFAGLNRILESSPEELKLDRVVVAGCDTNPTSSAAPTASRLHSPISSGPLARLGRAERLTTCWPARPFPRGLDELLSQLNARPDLPRALDGPPGRRRRARPRRSTAAARGWRRASRRPGRDRW